MLTSSGNINLLCPIELGKVWLKWTAQICIHALPSQSIGDIHENERILFYWVPIQLEWQICFETIKLPLPVCMYKISVLKQKGTNILSNMGMTALHTGKVV